jgi:hypothetical protein
VPGVFLAAPLGASVPPRGAEGPGAPDATAVTAGAPANLLLAPLYAPLLQPLPRLTDDEAFAEARAMARAGGAAAAAAALAPRAPRGAEPLGPRPRPRTLPLAVLASDMAAFKAANPQAGVVDFARW